MHIRTFALAALTAAVLGGTATGHAATARESTQNDVFKKGGFDAQAITKKFRDFYTEVANPQKLDRLGEYVAGNFEEHTPTQGARTKSGPAAVREGLLSLFAAFPDAKFDVDSIVVEGDQAVARFTFTGTQKGTFMNQPASGKKVKVAGIDWIRLDTDLKATEHWGFMDTGALMQQLGGKQQAQR